MAMNSRLDLLQTWHWEQVRNIYLEGMATGNATFESAVPGWEKWDAAHLQIAR